MNSDQAGNTAEEILDKHYKPKKHWRAYNRGNVLLAMSEYHFQFKQVEESDKEIERLQKELDAAAFDIDLFEKEIERLKGLIKRIIPFADLLCSKCVPDDYDLSVYDEIKEFKISNNL